ERRRLRYAKDRQRGRRLPAMMRLVVEEMRQRVAAPLRVGLAGHRAIGEVRQEIRVRQSSDETNDPRVLHLARLAQRVEILIGDLVQPPRFRPLPGETAQPDAIRYDEMVQ